MRDEVRVTKAAAAGSFLESLSQLQRGPGAELNAYLVRSLVITPRGPAVQRLYWCASQPELWSRRLGPSRDTRYLVITPSPGAHDAGALCSRRDDRQRAQG